MFSHIILVIDDNKDTVWLYQQLMTLIPAEHFEMSLLRNGKEALTFLKSRKPSVILLRYPVGCYRDIIRYIQSQAPLRWVPLVIVSGKPNIKDEHSGISGRFEHYQLPGNALELKRTIKRAIAQTKQRYLQDSKHSIFAQYSQADIKAKYLKLQELLANKNWLEADLETTRVTFQVDQEKLVIDSGIPARKAVVEAIDAFLLEDLQMIDYLWVIYSNGHFGFSVQWQILQQIKSELFTVLKKIGWFDDESFQNIDIDESYVEEFMIDGNSSITTDIHTKDFFDQYPIQGKWTTITVLPIALGWLSKGAPEWNFDCETKYSLDTPKGHLPTVGKQEMGVAFHHGYLLSWIFSKLYPRKSE